MIVLKGQIEKCALRTSTATRDAIPYHKETSHGHEAQAQ